MALYYYDKYTVKTSTIIHGYSNDRQGPSNVTDHEFLDGTAFPQNWTFSTTSGYSGLGPFATFSQVGVGGLVYAVSTTSVSFYIPQANLGGGRWAVKRTNNWRICDVDSSTSYSPGDYIETIVAEDGAYPENGRQDGFWWVRGDLVFPRLELMINDQLKISEYGWCGIDNQIKEVEKMIVRVNDQLKEL